MKLDKKELISFRKSSARPCVQEKGISQAEL
jgi:hypothetical protein